MTEKQRSLKIWIIGKLKELQELDDPEKAHIKADCALLTYIDDPEIQAEFEKIYRIY